MLILNRRVPLGNLSDDIDLNISRAVKGITLNVNDFMAISRLMRMSVRMYDYRKDSNAQTDTLEILFRAYVYRQSAARKNRQDFSGRRACGR